MDATIKDQSHGGKVGERQDQREDIERASPNRCAEISLNPPLNRFATTDTLRLRWAYGDDNPLSQRGYGTSSDGAVVGLSFLAFDRH